MTDEPANPPSEEPQQTPDRVECPAARDPAVRLFIGAGIALAMGIWCILDLSNYPYAPPGEDINQFAGWAFNHGLAILGPLIGLIVLVLALRFMKRTLVADSDGLGYVGKEKMAWDGIESVDATLLKDKGVVIVKPSKGDELKLDGWKLQNFKPLIALLERKVPEEKMKR
jgi:hypothetical protein